MLHEIKDIIKSARIANESGLKTVLASVVSLEGSSYRKPGVRMSIQENGKMIGAVSGGCVEKEILRQAQSVFENGKPKLMVYDGRYRLGCEGILYILISYLILKLLFILLLKNNAHQENLFKLTLTSLKKKKTDLKEVQLLF